MSHHFLLNSSHCAITYMCLCDLSVPMVCSMHLRTVPKAQAMSNLFLNAFSIPRIVIKQTVDGN